MIVPLLQRLQKLRLREVMLPVLDALACQWHSWNLNPGSQSYSRAQFLYPDSLLHTHGLSVFPNNAVVISVVPILQMSKMRFREVE